MLKKLIVFALVFCVAIPSLAQVELHAEKVTVDVREVYDAYTNEGKVVADFLYLRQKRTHCVSNRMLKDHDQWSAYVCVFEDPTTGAFILYTDFTGDCCVWPFFVVLYNDKVVSAVKRGHNYNLRPGNYEIIVLSHHRIPEPLHMVTFSIEEDQPVELRTEMIAFEKRKVFDKVSSEDRTVAEYFHQTLKDNSCVSFDLYEGIWKSGDAPADVCVFEDPLTGDYILFVTGVVGPGHGFVLLQNGHVVATPPRWKGVVPDLRPGNYELIIAVRGEPLHSVTFEIPNPGEFSSDD